MSLSWHISSHLTFVSETISFLFLQSSRHRDNYCHSYKQSHRADQDWRTEHSCSLCNSYEKSPNLCSCTLGRGDNTFFELPTFCLQCTCQGRESCVKLLSGKLEKSCNCKSFAHSLCCSVCKESNFVHENILMDLFYYTWKGWNSRVRYEIRDLIEKSKIDLLYTTILCQENFMDDIRRTCMLLQCLTL